MRPTNPPTLQILAHWRKEKCSACIKVHEGLASNLYVPQPLVHADKGGSWRTSTAPVKGDQEMQVSSEGLLRQLLRIHK